MKMDGLEHLLELPYIKKYILDVDDDHYVQRSQHPTEPEIADDWEARQIDIGDVDTFSRNNDELTSTRIRDWRARMDVMRRQFQ